MGCEDTGNPINLDNYIGTYNVEEDYNTEQSTKTKPHEYTLIIIKKNNSSDTAYIYNINNYGVYFEVVGNYKSGLNFNQQVDLSGIKFKIEGQLHYMFDYLSLNYELTNKNTKEKIIGSGKAYLK